MGTMIELSGTGCREFELYLQGQNRMWYVYDRAAQLGIQFSPYMGNGGDWMSASGYEVTMTTTKHAAVSFSPGQASALAPWGHVAFVEDVGKDGSILISQSNANGKLGVISYQVFSAAEAKQFHYVIGKWNKACVKASFFIYNVREGIVL